MRILVIVAAVALALPSSLATADEVHEGSILLGHPLTRTPVYAVNDRVAECNPDAMTNGLDSVFYAAGHWQSRRVTLQPETTLDADAFFWTSQCELIPYYGCAMFTRGSRERCTVPEGAAWATVEGALGSGNYTLTVHAT